ncbi:hypothetical protein [Stenotrophomonas maltophilia]|uniref:hypothetical protein n=1 Tax=Stenotrophomonas maltophilia TaxID=40324 RepID=UPI000DF81A59|nr:hypothetical protein [Stenotrophomonas maltophilia]MCF3486966.1 hypothetical protein [Stenotrophomonas maltophilia]
MSTVAQTKEDMQEEIARLRAELQSAAKAALDAVALSCANEREADALRAEAEALRKDAERYRWLRNDAITGTRHDPAVLKDGPTDCCDFMFGDELDAAIDAAMGASA